NEERGRHLRRSDRGQHGQTSSAGRDHLRTLCRRAHADQLSDRRRHRLNQLTEGPPDPRIRRPMLGQCLASVANSLLPASCYAGEVGNLRTTSVEKQSPLTDRQSAKSPNVAAFISHAKDDQKRAREIATSLEERGLKCWIAPRDVRPGQSYGDEIIR